MVSSEVSKMRGRGLLRGSGRRRHESAAKAPIRADHVIIPLPTRAARPAPTLFVYTSSPSRHHTADLCDTALYMAEESSWSVPRLMVEDAFLNVSPDLFTTGFGS